MLPIVALCSPTMTLDFLSQQSASSCKKNAALGDSRSVISDDGKSIVMEARNTNNSSIEEAKKSRMVLPFQPLSLTFNHINYYVDMPVMLPKEFLTIIRKLDFGKIHYG
ncbi:hypothetical protein CQW23_14722 [Capsicum baccatum]|uniref:Uncharacterized protein n=1 Tax=Capsicum baccatum TaxID=33114 RepID=A0A2G2WJZ6_CAPBA|nr:hypothetical protein CQW23_14722 [Capsicum baccatum]